MTFRNTALIIFIFLLLNSCKGLQYYRAGTNAAGISILMEVPSEFYTNEMVQDSVKIYVVNHNSQSLNLDNWWSNLKIVGRSRFYKKEVSIQPQITNPDKGFWELKTNDTILLVSIPIIQLLGTGVQWTDGTKQSKGPHQITAKKYYSYVYLTAELNSKIPNQADIIKIRSADRRITITQTNTPSLKSKKTILSLTSDAKQFDLKSKSGNLLISITNTGSYPIPLFSDPGSVRFKLYAYNANRTAIMFTQFVLDNGKLPIYPVNVGVNGSYGLSIPLDLLLFTETPATPIYYWVWNKKSPPVSPLLYGKKDIAIDVEFWFGVVVDGKEYLSNTLKINIAVPSKKSTKLENEN